MITEETIETLDVEITIVVDQIGMKTTGHKGLRGRKETIVCLDNLSVTVNLNHLKFPKIRLFTKYFCSASHIKSGTEK